MNLHTHPIEEQSGKDIVTANIPKLKWCFAPSFTELICLVAGAFFVFWYAWIMDDAYVYFRYVDNFVIHGKGLVWNPGEYVEGFSSPIWALFLSFFRMLRLNYWMIVRVTGLLCFIVFWWMGCLVNRGLTSSTNTRGIFLNIPLVYLTFTYGVSCYFTSGLESPFVLVVAAGYAAAILWPQSIALQILVGLSPLLRHEFLLPYLLFLAYALFLRRVRLYIAILSFFLSVGGYGLFRIWYYADLFPNSFYLKNGIWIEQGMKYVYDTVEPYQTVLYMLLMCLAYVIFQMRRYERLLTRERLAMLILALPVAAYVVKIGGDARHFRYLAFPFVLMVLATGGLAERFTQHIKNEHKYFLILPAALLGIIMFNNYPNQLSLHPFFQSHLQYKHSPFFKINDAVVHRFHKAGTTPSRFSQGHFLSYDESKRRYALELSHKRIADFRPLGKGWADLPKGKMPHSGLPLMAGPWCQDAYLHASVPTIHDLGLTEPFLARTKMLTEELPAHKFGLVPLTKDLLRVRSQYGFVQGAFDLAISEDKDTPAWIVYNIDALRNIERKVYNNHNFSENIKLAFLPFEKTMIDPQTHKENIS